MAITSTETAASTADLCALRDALGDLDPRVGDAERVDRIRLLEEIKAAATAAQVAEVVAFDSSQRTEQRAAGVREAKVGTGISHQVALAKRESPARARRFLGLAKVLAAEMPATLAELASGRTTEYRAFIVAKETLFLDRLDREVVDATLAPQLEQMSDHAVEAEARRLAQQLDAAGAVERAAAAERDRRVTIRPAPDTMVRLTALLPVAQGVSVYATLKAAAEQARAAGDDRGRGQVMADELVTRITGQTNPDDNPVEVQLVMTPETLFNSTGVDDSEADTPHEPAHLTGYGPIPADLARRIIGDTDACVFVRRIWSTPDRRRVLAIDTQRERFDGSLRRLLVARDQWCRTPWCGAPIRHIDHPVPRRSGGATTADTGQGLCEACNYAKEGLGWLARPGPDGAGEAVATTTPTGHRYVSRPPSLPGSDPFAPGPEQTGWLDRALVGLTGT